MGGRENGQRGGSTSPSRARFLFPKQAAKGHQEAVFVTNKRRCPPSFPLVALRWVTERTAVARARTRARRCTGTRGLTPRLNGDRQQAGRRPGRGSPSLSSSVVPAKRDECAFLRGLIRVSFAIASVLQLSALPKQLRPCLVSGLSYLCGRSSLLLVPQSLSPTPFRYPRCCSVAVSVVPLP